MDKKKIDFMPLYRLCNNEQLFTSGSTSQYEKMFKLAEDGITQNELLYILYVCSVQELDAINEMIAPLFTEDNQHEKH